MKRKIRRCLFLLFLTAGACGGKTTVRPPSGTKTIPATPSYTVRVVATFPHDPQAFTQGLAYHDGMFYEGTGLEGRSSLRIVEPETGLVRQMHRLAPDIFGEGIALFDDQIVQISWKNRLAFFYDRQTLRPLRKIRYAMDEGWGITCNDTVLIMSDGTPTLYFLDKNDMTEIRRVTVREDGLPVAHLNELEYIRGEVWANIWGSDDIVRISPQTGKVTGRIHLPGLLPHADRTPQTDVLNGIACDPGSGRIFVTGKNWPKLFEIELVRE